MMAFMCVSLFKSSYWYCLEIPCVCKRKITDFTCRLKQNNRLHFYNGLKLYNLRWLGVVKI
jgi:hypothetical protein